MGGEGKVVGTENLVRTPTLIMTTTTITTTTTTTAGPLGGSCDG